MSNIIDKIQVSGVTYDIGGSGGGGNPTVELTQAEYDALVTAGTVSADTYYIITDAQAGDLTNYYTKTEVDNAITAATSTKQDTLVSGTNIKTINNTSLLGSGNIDIQGGGGGGKAIEAGRGIAITTGETADTVSFDLPISAGTGNYSIIEGLSTSAMSLADHAEGRDTYANGGSYPAHAEGERTSATSFCCHAEGRLTKATNDICHAEGKGSEASGYISHAEGEYTKALAQYSHSEGAYTTASSITNVSGIQTYQGSQSRHAEGCSTFANNGCTHTEGYYTQANNFGEHASGVYNVSNSATTTYGDSGNTLFSVGNGTADNARHNAFEVRQNGDIYLSSGGTDIKLQDHLGGGGGGVNIVQTTGTSTTDVMSQNAATSNFIYKINLNYKLNGRDTLALQSKDKNLLIPYMTINGEKVLSTNDLSVIETSAITTTITSSSTDSQVPSAKAVNDKLGGLSLVKLTQAEYDALATKDNSTLYVIVN